MSLWIAIGFLTLISLVALVGPMVRGASIQKDDHDCAVYQEQLDEIARDMERGVLSEAEAEALRTEISRRMIKAGEKRESGEVEASAGGIRIVPAILLMAVVPLAALGIYRHLGSPEKPDLPYTSRTFAPPQDQAQASAEMNRLVDNLKRRMTEDPSRLDGWLLLGRSLMSLERFEEAADAYTSAHNLANQPKLVRPDIVASLAESSYMATGGQFTPLIREYLRTARAVSPRESKVLFYMGLDFARQKKFQDAIQIWTDLLSITPANAPRRVNLQHQISKTAKAGNIDATAVKSRLVPSVPPAASRATPSAAPADVPGASAGNVKAAEEMSDQDRQAFIRSMVERLAERLKETPTDIEGWKRLARAYQVLGDTAKAAAVVERIRQLEGGKRGRR